MVYGDRAYEHAKEAKRETGKENWILENEKQNKLRFEAYSKRLNLFKKNKLQTKEEVVKNDTTFTFKKGDTLFPFLTDKGLKMNKRTAFLVMVNMLKAGVNVDKWDVDDRLDFKTDGSLTVTKNGREKKVENVFGMDISERNVEPPTATAARFIDGERAKSVLKTPDVINYLSALNPGEKADFVRIVESAEKFLQKYPISILRSSGEFKKKIKSLNVVEPGGEFLTMIDDLKGLNDVFPTFLKMPDGVKFSEMYLLLLARITEDNSLDKGAKTGYYLDILKTYTDDLVKKKSLFKDQNVYDNSVPYFKWILNYLEKELPDKGELGIVPSLDELRNL